MCPEKIKKILAKKLVFFVHKHDASHLHFDFRLEVDGVLASWAVPKGFSLDPHIKHLAIHTEDHPYAYGTFEGTIPSGEYGAGTVMVWDRGTYRNEKNSDMATCIKKGVIEVWLEGTKLKGGFALVKMKKSNQWLFFKLADEYAHSGAELPTGWDRSALTGRTMAQIAGES